MLNDKGYFGMETEATSDQGQYMTATHQKKGGWSKNTMQEQGNMVGKVVLK